MRDNTASTLGEYGALADTDFDSRAELESAYLTMVEGVLPDRAADEAGWPVRWDHCFMRIAYDNAMTAQWDTVIDERPAYEALPAKRLFRAYCYALGMDAGGPPLCRRLNERSLLWRDELSLEDAEHITEYRWRAINDGQ